MSARNKGVIVSGSGVINVKNLAVGTRARLAVGRERRLPTDRVEPRAVELDDGMEERSRRGEFDVFICYKRSDQPHALKLARGLLRLGILPWLDVWFIDAGTSWQDALETQILQAPCAIVLVGASSPGSWQKKEIAALIRETAERPFRIIPVLLPGTAADRLQPFLAGHQVVELGDGMDEALDNLVVGIRAAITATRRDDKRPSRPRGRE